VVTGILPTVPAWADPPNGTVLTVPTIPPHILPPVFCFRITDISDVPGDPEGNAFDFGFEVLNWTNATVFGVSLSKASDLRGPTAGSNPSFSGSSIDAGGRPVGSGNDDANYSPADGAVMPAKIGAANGFTASGGSSTSQSFFSVGAGIPNRDLVGVPPGPGPARTAASLALVPSESGVGASPNFVGAFGRPFIPNFETIDNAGFAGDPLPNNTLDGLSLGSMISMRAN